MYDLIMKLMNTFQLEEIDFENNAFTWWCEREEKFPILSLLAKNIYLYMLVRQQVKDCFPMPAIC